MSRGRASVRIAGPAGAELLRLIRGPGSIVVMKILGGIAAILGATLITFVLLRVAPGDPARLTLGPLASDAAVRAQDARLGLNHPIYIQYERYISQFVRGDWGFVYGAGQPVTQQLSSRLPASLELGVYAFLLAFVSSV